MSAACPQCAAPDHAVPIPRAVADPSTPLDGPTRALLAPPPEPRPAPGQAGTASTVLYGIAAALAVLGVVSLLHGARDLDRYDAAYRLGYRLGPFVLPGLLVVCGLIVQAVSRRRRRQAAAIVLPAQKAQWQRNLSVWQAGWLCLGCRAAFFPDAAIRPDFPASPALPLDQFPLWVMTAAERAFGPTSPPVPH
ncbi:hypothetical protein ACIRS1_34160 [Kitasatospora sp. NPDC101176]|uniref:hypothetical protein n=1 Tax=Kitasatospora sp. NPDC101176 TaxID=3364099 RepID=UPI0038129A14